MAKIKDNTRRVLSEFDSRVISKLTMATLLVERSAKEFCPRLAERPPKNPSVPSTGTARRSITHVLPFPKGKSYVAIVGSNITYFPYLEMGTVHFVAFAPLRKGLAVNRSKIKSLFKGV